MCTVRQLQRVVVAYVNKVDIESSVKNVIKTRSYSFSKNLIQGEPRKLYRRMNSNVSYKNTFRFTDYDCLGFDLDNTICRYKIGAMVKLEYDAMSKYLVELKKYPATHLYKPIEENLDFMLKGLILDVTNGNVLRIGSNGYILHGSHGTTELSRQQLIEYYGPECRWKVADLFLKDPLHTWNGPISEEIRTLLDYFDMPAGLVFARAVDTIDEINGGRQQKYQVWADILEALQDMFNRDHFRLDKGGYFPHIKSSPEIYIHKCSENLINWFKALKKLNKVLFLITGSNADFASHTAENSMGSDWKELFDVVVFFAKKPGFFTQDRPFIKLNGFEETEQVQSLIKGGMYTHGNWSGLYDFLKKTSNKNEPKVLYIGDNLVQDIYAPAVHTPCDTVAICEELEAEGVDGYVQQHSDLEYLISSTWGSYFSHTDGETSTIWKNIIANHANLCIPSLEHVASKPLDHNYC